MSRTWKDRPTRVRLHENMKKGLIDHDHLRLSTGPRVTVSRFPDRDLSANFYKHEVKELRSHLAMLDSLVAEGFVAHYELVEKPGFYDYRSLSQWDEPRREFKSIDVLVYRRYVYEGQDLCTDADHYDSLTRTDKRNGKRAVCTPTWTDDLNRYGSHKCERAAYSRSKVRGSLKQARDLANAGELDEDYSDPTYEEPYAKKLWVC